METEAERGAFTEFIAKLRELEESVIRTMLYGPVPTQEELDAWWEALPKKLAGGR